MKHRIEKKDLLEIIKGDAIIKYPSEYDRYDWLRSAYVAGAKAMLKLKNKNINQQ